jgi:lipopolysaccharide biosynthesis glycosyltransferase
MKFSDNYIKAQVTNSQGKPVAKEHLDEKAKDQAYLAEMIQLNDEYQGSGKPWDEDGAKRLRELWMKYYKMPKMQEYHQKRQEEEILQGGLADGVPASEFDPDDLAEGTRVEMEHTTDVKLAQEIASDHLSEDKTYYKKLKTMEAK